MNNLISRQAAIDTVKFGITYAKAINKSTGEVKELFKEGNKALNEAVERLEELPPAQSGQKTGKWNHGYCSECGYYWGKDAPIANVPNYCPNCGARMDGGKAEYGDGTIHCGAEIE